MKWISLGDWNKYYFLILLLFTVDILDDYICGEDYNSNFNMTKLFPTEIQTNLYKHSTVHQIFKYIGVLFISIILFKYERKTTKKESNNNNLIKNDNNLVTIYKSTSKIELIHTKKQNNLNIYVSPLSVFFIISIWVVNRYLTEIYLRSGFKDLNFWIFEIALISYFHSKLFNLKIYNHQKCAIIFNLIICSLFRLISFFISFKSDEDSSIYPNNYYYIPIGIVFYLITITLRAYSITKIKWLIDIKYISSIKVLINSGLIGIISFSIIITLETLIKCPDIKVTPFLCNISYYDENKNITSLYIDNIYVYFKILKGDIIKTENITKEIIIEVVVIFLGMIFYFLYLYLYVLIIKNLSPIHCMFTNTIYYIVSSLLLLLNNKITTGYYFQGEEKLTLYKFYKFIFDFSADFISFFCLLIYLEIIELNFCKLNINLRNRIIQRSREDLNLDYNVNDLDSNSQLSSNDDEII